MSSRFVAVFTIISITSIAGSSLKVTAFRVLVKIWCVTFMVCSMTVSIQTFRVRPGPQFNIKMSSCQYRKSHCGDKTVVRSSYLHDGISYTGKMSSLYWIGAQDTVFTKFKDLFSGTCIEIAIIKMRRSSNHLIFIMLNSTLSRPHFYTEMFSRSGHLFYWFISYPCKIHLLNAQKMC